MTRVPLVATLLLTGCSLVEQAHADKLAAASDTDGTTDDTSETDTTGPPEPTTGGSTGETTGPDITTDTGSISLGEPPVIRDFFVDATIQEAGPLWIDAEVADAVRTRLVIERGGEEVAAVDDPKLPWEFRVTSESTFDGSYTITLQAWASGGAQATASRDVMIDLPTGGTVAASWEDSGDRPSSVAALGIIRADNVAPSDGVIAALAVDGQDGPEMRLYRFDTDLTLKNPVQAWCGGDICRWTPTGLVVDEQNHVWVVGNDDEFSWLMKFDANGQPLWSEAHKLHGGHATGVAVDDTYTYIAGWADKSENLSNWTDARIWVVQSGVTVGVLDYGSVLGEDQPANNRAHGVAITSTGRVLLAGETQVFDPNDNTRIPRATLLEFTGLALDRQWQAPTWVDGWEQSVFGVIAPNGTDVVAAGWYAPGVSDPLVHYAVFSGDLEPAAVTSSNQPKGTYSALATHPEGHVIKTGIMGSSAVVSAPDLWGSVVLPPFTRSNGVQTDRYGRILIAGEALINGEIRAMLTKITP